MQAYEERFLFLLLLLRQPRARLIYITSQSILPSVIEYYLGLLPGVIISHARARLLLVSPQDRSSRPLTIKVLERPQLIDRIRSLIPDCNRAHLVPYNTTYLERDLALRLGIPMYGADPKFFPLGTKTGSRRLFAEAGIPHPPGYGDIRSIPAAVAAICEMRRRKPEIAQVLVKLNESLSGEGNAVVDLQGLPEAGAAKEVTAVEASLRAMRCELASLAFEAFCDKLTKHGGVVEERITGEEFRSPSVQLRITPLGEVELLSTHDQLLGGAGGQSYLGCRFPADTDYAAMITHDAMKVGLRLAKEGVVYDADKAVFVTRSGREKHFVATDHLESPAYRALSPDDLFDIALRHGLHFNQSRETGVVFNMLASLAENGRIGLVAVGDSAAEADALYRRTQSVLDEEARLALAPRALPAI